MDEQSLTSSPEALRLSRRRLVGVGAGLAAGALLGRAGSALGALEAAEAQKTFTIATWGGTTQDAILRGWGAEFTRRTGAKVVAVTPVDYGKYVAQIRSKKVAWDWIDAEGFFPFQYPELMENINFKALGLRKSDMVHPSLWRPPKAIASYLTSYLFGYRTDQKGPRPKNWIEFFDTKNFPGKRSLYNWPPAMIEIALLGDGVPYKKLYPLDVDRALAKIKSIRDDLVFWNTGAEAQQFLVSGSADFVVIWANRLAPLALGGVPVQAEWNQALTSPEMHFIPKNDPRKALCLEWIKACLDPKASAKMALYSGTSPVTKKGYALTDNRLKPWLPTYPKNAAKQAGYLNWDWWAENIDETVKKWYATF